LPTSPPPSDDPKFPPAEQALARQVAARRQEDPLAGAKTGAGVFYDNLMKVLQKDPNGVRAELLIGVPAVLAGFACQAATWESLVVGEGYPVHSVFTMATAEDGTVYPFSDPMNQLLLEDQFSVWSLAAGAAQAAGAQTLPDVEEAVEHVAQTIGTPEFGQPRLPGHFSLGADTPTGILEGAWPRFLGLLGLTCAMPEEWPVLFGFAMQRAIDTVKDLIDPASACQIALECALPMAHLPMARV
jgi:hypothetical protein